MTHIAEMDIGSELWPREKELLLALVFNRESAIAFVRFLMLTQSLPVPVNPYSSAKTHFSAYLNSDGLFGL